MTDDEFCTSAGAFSNLDGYDPWSTPFMSGGFAAYTHGSGSPADATLCYIGNYTFAVSYWALAVFMGVLIGALMGWLRPR